MVIRHDPIYLTGEKSTPRGLPVLFVANDVARCRECMIAVRLEGDTIMCSECHRWRRVGVAPERKAE